MPRKHPRLRVERGLYRVENVYWACATAPGEQTARWHKVGVLGIQAARRERDKFAYELKTGAIAQTIRSPSMRKLSDEWFARLDELELAGEIRPRTAASYKSGTRLHILPVWGSRDVRSITADDLVAWHERQRLSGAATWTIRARWMSVRGLLGYATRVGYLAGNPCDVLTRRERPKPGRARTRYLSSPEIQGILQTADQQGKMINALLIFTGARAAELLELAWRDINFAEGQIQIRFQMSRTGDRVALKTESGKRDVILMQELARLLRAHKVASRFSDDEDLVIGNGVGKTLGYTRLRKAFAGAADNAGIVGATPHTCRHTFASILIDNGRSVEFVSQQLGHASTKTTWDIYVHLFRAREQAQAAKDELDAAYGHMLRPAIEPRETQGRT